MSATAQQPSSSKKNKSGQRLLAIIAVLLLLNIAAYYFYGQFDLTKDRRYTITPATTNMLKHLDNKVEVLVFLKGDELPAAFQSLAKSTDDLLRHFRDISDTKVDYRFIDPLGNDTSVLTTLAQFRMTGIPVTINAGKKGTSQKMIFPWALVTTIDASGKEVAFPVFLQETNTQNVSRTLLNKSVILLEYNMANAIHQISKKEKAAVAYLTGNDESFGYSIWSAFNTLGRYYNLDTLNLQQNNTIPARYKTIIVNRPMKAFTDADKFKLDQYVMNGGNIFWSIDAVTGSLDSFRNASRFNAMPLDLNINDLLFHYGVRINPNLIEDAVDFAGIPLAAPGNSGTPEIRPWVYFPVLKAGSEHPVVKNTGGVLSRFVSSVDTNSNDASIKKTILLASSKYSKTESAPLPIILETAIEEVHPATYTKRNVAAAVLLEGAFTSFYAGHMPQSVQQWADSLHLTVTGKAKSPGKMIIAGDGDLLTNEISPKEGPLDLGIYRYSDYKFDNKSFLLNSIEYLTDPDNLLEARTKNIDNRILDPKRVEQERSSWQFINIGIPVGLILLLAAVFFFVRKRKYA
jgi:ABC-2 type transport system permease protein